MDEHIDLTPEALENLEKVRAAMRGVPERLQEALTEKAAIFAEGMLSGAQAVSSVMRPAS